MALNSADKDPKLLEITKSVIPPVSLWHNIEVPNRIYNIYNRIKSYISYLISNYILTKLLLKRAGVQSEKESVSLCAEKSPVCDFVSAAGNFSFLLIKCHTEHPCANDGKINGVVARIEPLQ